MQHDSGKKAQDLSESVNVQNKETNIHLLNWLCRFKKITGGGGATMNTLSSSLTISYLSLLHIYTYE